MAAALKQGTPRVLKINRKPGLDVCSTPENRSFVNGEKRVTLSTHCDHDVMGIGWVQLQAEQLPPNRIIFANGAIPAAMAIPVRVDADQFVRHNQWNFFERIVAFFNVRSARASVPQNLPMGYFRRH